VLSRKESTRARTHTRKHTHARTHAHTVLSPDPQKRPTALALLGHHAFLDASKFVVCSYCEGEFVPSDGVTCSHPGDKHFLCDDCFGLQVSSQCSDKKSLLVMRQGKTVCPWVNKADVSSPFTDAHVFVHTTARVQQAYITAGNVFVNHQQEQEVQVHVKRELKKAMERLAALDARSLVLEKHKMHLEEEVMRNHCTRWYVSGVFVCFCFWCRVRAGDCDVWFSFPQATSIDPTTTAPIATCPFSTGMAALL
jgi:hypothetical protein